MELEYVVMLLSTLVMGLPHTASTKPGLPYVLAYKNAMN